MGACAKRKNGAQTTGGKRSGRSAKDESSASFDFKSEEQVKQRMKSLVQELKKEEEAEQRERAGKQENGKSDELDAGTTGSRKRKPQKVRKCNVSLNKPISLEEYDDDEYDESDDEPEVVNSKPSRSRNGNYAKINNEHDYYSVSNGDKEENEQIIEINGEIIKGAQIVYVGGKELTEGQQVATIQVLNGNGGDLIETAEVVADF